MDRIDALTKKLFKMKSMVQTTGVGSGTHADQMVDNEIRERFKVRWGIVPPLFPAVHFVRDSVALARNFAFSAGRDVAPVHGVQQMRLAHPSIPTPEARAVVSRSANVRRLR